MRLNAVLRNVDFRRKADIRIPVQKIDDIGNPLPGQFLRNDHDSGVGRRNQPRHQEGDFADRLHNGPPLGGIDHRRGSASTTLPGDFIGDNDLKGNPIFLFPGCPINPDPGDDGPPVQFFRIPAAGQGQHCTQDGQ
ncbi:hypothetical protein D3C76_1345030 [compost metagenome]